MDQVVHQDANLVAEQRVATGVKVAFAGQTENITGQAQRPGRDRWGGGKRKRGTNGKCSNPNLTVKREQQTGNVNRPLCDESH